MAIANINFEGNTTLNQLDDINELLNQYDDKFNHGSSLVDDGYNDKSIQFLKTRRNELLGLLEQFNADTKNHISKNLEMASAKKKSKKTAVLLAIPLLGFQWTYLNSIGYTFLSILLCWTIIVPVINLLSMFKLILMAKEKFDLEFNL